MKESTRNILLDFADRNPSMSHLVADMDSAFALLKQVFAQGGTLYVCGNGGSQADSEHIAGELLKSFKKCRPIDSDFASKLCRQGEVGERVLQGLEGGLPVIPLGGFPAFASAFANDKDSACTFAQLVSVLATEKDALLTLSTSGNSQNCVYAATVAKAKGVPVLFMGGGSGGKLKALADVSLIAPESETYKVQECHLPMYHCLCAMLEEEFF